jgi:hypothetical protein
MRFFVYLKNNVCMAKGICKSVEDAEAFMAFYDAVEDVTEEVYKTISIPSVKVNGNWEKNENIPVIEYPEGPVPEEQPHDVSVYDELAAAYREGVQGA